jgi:hypothetical protein
LTQNLIDLTIGLHGSPPDLFLWSGAIFLPAGAYRNNRQNPAGDVAIS